MIISKNKETELLRNKKADEFVVCLKFHVYALLYTCLLAFVLIFLGSLNAYMIIPRLGHQSIFLNGIMYVFIIFTAFVCFKNIQEYKEERDEKLNLIYGLYVLPIINSEAYKIAFKEASGADLINLDDIESNACIPVLDEESTEEWMYD